MPSSQTRTITVHLTPSKTTTITLTEPQGVQAENLSLTTWGSSFVLANRLHTLSSSVPAPPSSPVRSVPPPPSPGGHHSLNDTITKSDDTPDHVDRQIPITIPILELGAGTGLVGLTAAKLWRSFALLTDLEGIAEVLEGNISANFHHHGFDSGLKGKGGGAEGGAEEGSSPQPSTSSPSCAAGILDWSRPGTVRIGPDLPENFLGGDDDGDHSHDRKLLRAGEYCARIILAADTVYYEEHPPLLVQTILAWLEKGGEARVVLAYPLRIAYLDHIRDLWERLEKTGLECIEEGKDEENDDESWDEPAPYEWCVWKWKDSKLENHVR